MRAVIFIHVLYLILIKTFTVKGAVKCDSRVELRAVLLSCPVKDSGCDDDDPLSQAMKAEESQILDADPRTFDKLKDQKSREFPSAVKECKRKLIITLKIKNAGKIPCDDEYIVVDHVFDPLTNGRGRLLSPIVIKLRQEQMVQLYGLQFQRVINSDPFEEQRQCEGACSVAPESPSCGIATYNGKPIPYSEGFCCSCDPHVNAKRQSSSKSHVDPLSQRNSKLVHPKNSHQSDEEKTNFIYKPELVKLKPGISNDIPPSKDDGSEIFDALFGDKIPNFMMEGDRKIVCDRGDFMRELCLLRDDMKDTTARAEGNPALHDAGKENRLAGGIRDLSFLAVPEVTTAVAEKIAPQSMRGDLEKNTLELQNFIKALSLDHVSSPEPLTTKGIRGKRENRRESKKLTLEEKLNRFASAKDGGTGRRKRLMEIPHKRFRKFGDRRPYVDDSSYVMDTWKCPPRYFFSHDRAIIDPLESLDTNVTYDYLKESARAYPAKGKEFLTAKSQNCKTFKDGKEDRSFFQLSNNENRMTKKNKLYGGKVAFKKEKQNEEQRLEKGVVKLKKDDVEEQEEDSVEEKGAGKNEIEALAREPAKNRKSQFHAKSLRNFLCKSDHDISRLKHLFSARGKEKDRMDLLKPKGANQREESEYEKTSNEEKFEVKNNADGSRSQEVWSMLQFSTEKIDILHQPVTEQGIKGRQKMSKEDDRKYYKPTVRKYEGRISQPGKLSTIGTVNYKIKFTGSKAQEGYQRKSHTSLSGKNRLDAAPKWRGSNAFVGKTQKIRQNPFLPYVPSQKYYYYESLKNYPEKYLVKSSSPVRDTPRNLRDQRKDHLDFFKIDRLQDDSAYLKKKSRGRFLSVEEYPDDNPYSAKWSDEAGLRDPHPRGKRHPEMHRQKTPEYPSCVRNKRSAPNSFQPAKGFYESDFDPQKSEGHVIHDLETCMRRRSCQLPRQKHDNLSTEANAVSLDSPLAGPAKRSPKLPDKQRLIQSYLNAPDYVLEEVAGAAKGKREASGLRKTKSFQEYPMFECADTQETAHCMRFGDLWYGLYTIRKPMISQLMGIQLFDKHTVGEGTEWRDLTKGKMIRIGTFLAKAEDELPTISVTFTGERTGRTKNTIDPDNYFLLIPTHVSDASKAGFYPQIDGGPAEYMLIPSRDISTGGECNMIGTSFEAFAQQPDRCSQRKGSCLKRQPVDLWREDMEARIRGKRGKYFVENFGTVPNSPIKSYTNLTGEFLALEYYGEYTSTIEIELKADSNSIIRRGSIAQIPSVFIDSTSPKKTRIILSILNIGLTSSNFRPRLGDCPPDLDVAWCPLEGPLVTIPPYQRHDFKLDLSGALPSREVLLTVQVLNQVNKDVAKRKIIIKKDYRCVCAFHCKCNCLGSSKDSRTCRRLNLEEYRRAGYIGPFPFRAGIGSNASTGNFVKKLHVVLITATTLLLCFGVVKGILGIFIRRIGIAGVRVITGPRTLSCYYESELKGCTVLFDECGFPVHPTTCRPVQIVPLFFEILLNFLFFFLYPLRGLWFVLTSLSCCSVHSDCDSCCRREESDNDRKCSRPLLSRDPDPTCVQYNLTTFNPKKWKQDYLPYPAYKGDDDPLEEDDTEFVLQEMKRYRKK